MKKYIGMALVVALMMGGVGQVKATDNMVAVDMLEDMAKLFISATSASEQAVKSVALQENGVAMAGSEETVTEVTAETVAEVAEQKQETERKTERKHTESKPQQSAPKPQSRPQQSAPQAQAKPQSKPQQTAPKPQAKPQTQATTQKPKPKPQAQATTTKQTYKQKGYYVCNGCGYRTTGANAWEKMDKHQEKQMLAKIYECGSFRTAWE